MAGAWIINITTVEASFFYLKEPSVHNIIVLPIEKDVQGSKFFGHRNKFMIYELTAYQPIRELN